MKIDLNNRHLTVLDILIIEFEVGQVLDIERFVVDPYPEGPVRILTIGTKNNTVVCDEGAGRQAKNNLFGRTPQRLSAASWDMTTA